ncbi:MAG: sterol desaturase family protein [Myxococcota bacterium]
MGFNPIAAAIPVFFACIGLEAAVAYAQGRAVYRFNDAISDLSCGITSQIAGVFTKGLTAAAYIGLYASARLFDLPDTHWATWVFAFVFTDFAYYLWHRWTHEMNLGWASHVVHHQSEDYNLAVALRQSITSSWTSWPFYLPMALIGVSPFVAFTCSALNTLYQFWIHTELVGTLGPLEWILNTPSHHRVHHGVNPQYLDKNYAGVFIVWDRMLGTFEPEVEPPVYGTVKPLESWNPLWANVWWVDRMVRQTAATPAWSDKLAVWWRGPAFQPAGTEPVAPRGPEKFDTEAFPGTSVYVALSFLPVAVLTTWVIWVADSTPLLELAAPCGLIALSTVVWAGLYERRAWAIPLEVARLVAVGAWALTAF